MRMTRSREPQPTISTRDSPLTLPSSARASSSPSPSAQRRFDVRPTSCDRPRVAAPARARGVPRRARRPGDPCPARADGLLPGAATIPYSPSCAKPRPWRRHMPGQTPFSQIFPPPPKDYQSPWHYASLQSFWLYYLVDPDVLRSRLATLPAADELEVALFDVGGDRSALASVDLQRYTGQGPTYLES